MASAISPNFIPTISFNLPLLPSTTYTSTSSDRGRVRFRVFFLLLSRPFSLFFFLFVSYKSYPGRPHRIGLCFYVFRFVPGATGHHGYLTRRAVSKVSDDELSTSSYQLFKLDLSSVLLSLSIFHDSVRVLCQIRSIQVRIPSTSHLSDRILSISLL